MSEPIQIREFYTAKYPGNWHIEILDSANEASTLDEAQVSDGKSTSTERLFPFPFVCCDSRHVWLSLDPVVLLYRNRQTPYRVLHLPKPGKYEVYVMTRRVFSRDRTMTTYSGLGFAVTSANILKIELVP